MGQVFTLASPKVRTKVALVRGLRVCAWTSFFGLVIGFFLPFARIVRADHSSSSAWQLARGPAPHLVAILFFAAMLMFALRTRRSAAELLRARAAFLIIGAASSLSLYTAWRGVERGARQLSQQTGATAEVGYCEGFWILLAATALLIATSLGMFRAATSVDASASLTGAGRE